MKSNMHGVLAAFVWVTAMLATGMALRMCIPRTRKLHLSERDRGLVVYVALNGGAR